jgi:hypothetical protein
MQIQIALDRSKCQRQIKDGISALNAAAMALRSMQDISPQLEIALHDRILRLQIVLDRMSNVKEFGTPQGIRSLTRAYVCLIIPLFFGPYWSYIGSQTNFGFTFFLSTIVQVALTGLLNVALALEDPWNNSGLDGIFIDEQLYEVESALEASGAGSLVHGGALTTTDNQGQAGDRGDVPGTNGTGAPVEAPATSRVVRVATDTV